MKLLNKSNRNKITASAGDIKLCKFLLVLMDKLIGVDENHYDEFLHGYFYVWNYTYNTLTKHTDDRMYAHSDVIDNLPESIRRSAKELVIWGKTDYFKDNIRFIIVNDEYLSSDEVEYIKHIVMR